MNNEWQHLESIFHTALDLTGEERNLYLSEACTGNEPLFSEVRSLISAFESKSDFMEQPAFSLGLNVIQQQQQETQPEQDLTGTQIATYEIKRKLGSGGMGDVYLAEDTRLSRPVALKFLKTSFIDDQWAKRQLIKEAQAVAMLEHPNICAVHSIQEVDNHYFIVMPYIQGATLAQFTRDSQLGIEDASSIARQIVGALAYAHSHGIIHRDIKPGNIMITPELQAKTLDFGLAKVIKHKPEEPVSQISQNGLVLGTVSYMSPEQLRAEKLDYRSDIFSVGIVLYELFAGENPFNHKSQAETIAAILKYQPAALRSLNPQVPEPLAAIVQKCLNKDKEHRFQSAVELLVELENLKDQIIFAPAPRKYTGIYKYAAFVFVLLFCLVGGAFFYSRQAAEVSNFAVLPILNQSDNVENDYLGEGLTESLINKLSNFTHLRVKPFTLVSRYKGQEITPQSVGRELNVKAVLVGKIFRRGDSTWLQVNLVNTADGTELWSNEYKVEGSDLINSQEEISAQITSKLQVNLSDEEKQLLGKRQTNVPEAYDQYTLGRYFLNNRDKRNIDKAIVHFRTAIDIDPLYARAWSGLADSYVLKSLPAYGSFTPKEAMTKAKAAALEALSRDENLCEAHNSLGMVKLRYEWNWPEAEAGFLKAIERNPDYAPPHYWYSNLLIIRKNFKKAMSEAEKARELDPLSPNSEINIARISYYARQNDQAIQILNKTLENDSTNKNAAYLLGLTYMQKGLYNEAITIFEKFYQNDKIYFAAQLGYAYGKTNRKAEALRILGELEELSKQNIIPPQEMAIIHLGLGNKDKAFELFNLSCRERFPSLPFLLMEPFFDDERSTPPFKELANCIKSAP
jgi:eukaryotic-like serine/threonine-protein kinase